MHHHTKCWVLEVVASVIAPGLAVQWGKIWSARREWRIFVWGKSKKLHWKGNISVGFGSMSQGFLGEDGRKDRRNCEPRMEHVYRCIIPWKDQKKGRNLGAYSVKGKSWKGWSSQIVKAFVDHAKECGFHPSHWKMFQREINGTKAVMWEGKGVFFKPAGGMKTCAV